MIRKVLFILMILIPSLTWARPEVLSPLAPFAYTSIRLDIMPEARVFQGQLGSLHVKCMDVGPEDGVPLVLEGGIGLSVIYLRKFIRSLNGQGFRVFTCNRPGQGQGLLYSGLSTPVLDMGIDSMLKILPALRSFAYHKTGRQKVVLAGHSLGGVVVRAGSLGIEFKEKNEAYVSKKAAAMARRETSMIVPMFTLALTGDDLTEGSSVYKHMHLKEILPIMASCVENVQACMVWPATGIVDLAVASYLRLAQNILHEDIFGVRDVDAQELHELGRHLLPQGISKQYAVNQDAQRWLDGQAYTTQSGLDFGKLFHELQTSLKPLPMLAFVGKKDRVTGAQRFKEEVQSFHHTKVYELETGHIGAFLSRSATDQMALIIRQAHEGRMQMSCRQWLSYDFANVISK